MTISKKRKKKYSNRKGFSSMSLKKLNKFPELRNFSIEFENSMVKKLTEIEDAFIGYCSKLEVVAEKKIKVIELKFFKKLERLDSKSKYVTNAKELDIWLNEEIPLVYEEFEEISEVYEEFRLKTLFTKDSKALQIADGMQKASDEFLRKAAETLPVIRTGIANQYIELVNTKMNHRTNNSFRIVSSEFQESVKETLSDVLASCKAKVCDMMESTASRVYSNGELDLDDEEIEELEVNSSLSSEVVWDFKKGRTCDKDFTQYKYIELNKMAEQKGFMYSRCNGDHGIFKNSKGEIVLIPQRTMGKGLQLKILKTIGVN